MFLHWINNLGDNIPWDIGNQLMFSLEKSNQNPVHNSKKANILI
uniref:Uncharacterized protein n=1 Tax=Rhizophora mucronata TaxID=61149 RepID=A0A2P2NHJ1_RHIMU